MVTSTAIKAVQPQPQLRFLLSPPRRVVHKASGGILIGIDESGAAEEGDDSLSIPERASAGPLLWLTLRTPSGHVHIYSKPIVLCLPISFSVYYFLLYYYIPDIFLLICHLLSPIPYNNSYISDVHDHLSFEPCVRFLYK